MKIFLINVKTICAKRSFPPFFSFTYSFWELTIFVCFYKNEVLSQNSTVTFFPFKTNAFDGAAVKVTLLNLDLWPTSTSGTEKQNPVLKYRQLSTVEKAGFWNLSLIVLRFYHRRQLESMGTLLNITAPQFSHLQHRDSDKAAEKIQWEYVKKGLLYNSFSWFS